MTTTLATPAWLLVGAVRTVPGVLRLDDDDRISFTSGEGVVFEAPLAQVGDVKFPWYYFGGGVKLRVGDERYRVSFLKPNAGGDVPEHLIPEEPKQSMKSRLADAAGALTVDLQVATLARGRKAGKAWRAALGAKA